MVFGRGRPRRWTFALDRRITVIAPDRTQHTVWAARQDKGSSIADKTSSDVTVDSLRTLFYFRQEGFLDGIGTSWLIRDERGRNWKIVSVREYRKHIFWEIQVAEVDQ